MPASNLKPPSSWARFSKKWCSRWVAWDGRASINEAIARRIDGERDRDAIYQRVLGALALKLRLWTPDAAARKSASLDHLVGELLESQRNLETERLGGLEIDDKLVLGSLFHRQVGRFSALEDFVDVGGSAPSYVAQVRRITDEAARLHILLGPEHARQPVR